MQELWMSLWTFLWFVGLGIFSLLSVLVIVFAGFDLVALLTSLRARHQAQQAQATPPDGGSA